MSTTFERPPDETAIKLSQTSGGLDSSPAIAPAATLATLPLGAHLVVRCRKDWRTATVVALAIDQITLSVSSPTGRTYRLRRPPDALLTFDGHVPLLGATAASCWRAGLARYDVRW